MGVATVLGFIFGFGLPRARAEIIPHVDEKGRRIYINIEDEEMRVAVERGGMEARKQLLEKRKRSLPGIDQHINEVSHAHSVDPELVRAVIEVESAWNPRAYSRKGALGLMQLLPATGARFGLRGDPFNPRQNVSAGVRYLRFLLDRFNDDLELALAAYNAGENAVEGARGVPAYPETRIYLNRVQAIYGKLQGRVRGTTSIYGVVENGRLIFTNE